MERSCARRRARPDRLGCLAFRQYAFIQAEAIANAENEARHLRIALAERDAQIERLNANLEELYAVVVEEADRQALRG